MEMEQNLEEVQQQPSADALEFDSDLREEADHGFHQIRTIPGQLSNTPHKPPRSRSVGTSDSPGNTALRERSMSHSSPPNRVSSPLSLGNDTETAITSGRAGPGGGESSSASGQDLSEQLTDSKRRKFPVPSEVCIKQRGTGTDAGSDEPPEDGFTWRKYGQTDILGSKYPRSHYRCMRKKDMNCPARKRVQCSAEDPTIFYVG